MYVRADLIGELVAYILLMPARRLICIMHRCGVLHACSVNKLCIGWVYLTYECRRRFSNSSRAGTSACVCKYVHLKASCVQFARDTWSLSRWARKIVCALAQHNRSRGYLCHCFFILRKVENFNWMAWIFKREKFLELKGFFFWKRLYDFRIFIKIFCWDIIWVNKI